MSDTFHAAVFGTMAAEFIHMRFRNFRQLHWRQLVLIQEIAFLLIVVFLPHSVDPLANALVSFRLRHAGAALPQGARPRLREHDVHRQYAQRHRIAVRLLFPRFLAPTDNRSWANNRFLYTNVLRSFRCFCNLLLVLSIPVTLPHA